MLTRWTLEMFETGAHEYYHALVALKLVPRPRNLVSEEAIADLVGLCSVYPVVFTDLDLELKSTDFAENGPRSIAQEMRREPPFFSGREISRAQLRNALGSSRIERGDRSALDRMVSLCRAAIREAPDLTDGYFLPPTG